MELKTACLHNYFDTLTVTPLTTSSVKRFANYKLKGQLTIPRSPAFKNSRGMIYKEENYALLHTKYEFSKALCFREEYPFYIIYVFVSLQKYGR